MKTIQKRAILLLLAVILCLPAMSIRADAVNTASAMLDGGMSHSIALSSSGTVYVWGSNEQMQLGLADTSVRQQTPRQVKELSNMVSVAAGYNFSAALSFNGTVYTWGDGRQSSPTLVSGLNGIIAIAAGQSGLLALDRNGNVWQWTLGGAPAQVQGLSNVAAIDAGGSHYLALTAYGDVYAWGVNRNGQLGVGNTTDYTTPQRVDLYNIVGIAAGQSHSIAVAFDGTIYTWGANSYGQLGNGTATSSNAPVRVQAISKAVQVSAGIDTSMALTEDGELYSWGYGEFGQLGNGDTATSQSIPRMVSYQPDGADQSNKPVFIASGAYHNLFVTGNGSVYAWGRNRDYQLGIQPNSSVTAPQMVSGITTPVGESYQANVLGTASSWALPELQPLYETDLISPILWNKYQDKITRAEFAHMLVTVYEKVSGTTAPTNAVSFFDIDRNLFKSDIIKAYNLGITSGTSATTFSPDSTMNREQAVKMICSFLVMLVDDITIPERVTSMTYYPDAASISDWAVPYVAYAHSENIMKGTDTGFSPKAELTRESALLIVGRVIAKYQWG